MKEKEVLKIIDEFVANFRKETTDFLSTQYKFEFRKIIEKLDGAPVPRCLLIYNLPETPTSFNIFLSIAVDVFFKNLILSIDKFENVGSKIFFTETVIEHLEGFRQHLFEKNSEKKRKTHTKKTKNKKETIH